ncbi:hypothetical protein QJS04_geneDACA021372 [Acorus gramineus]|uniref:Uncharacterized protein n=1 Tax=Acorus gramineus TaxID=55184 RepID=A0AAV9ALG6_ACOGR|nr:hypothetical protein QJS04_geneDACA021372 [Acorus gramineus]
MVEEEKLIGGCGRQPAERDGVGSKKSGRREIQASKWVGVVLHCPSTSIYDWVGL